MPLPVLERGRQGRIVRRTGRRGPVTPGQTTAQQVARTAPVENRCASFPPYGEVFDPPAAKFVTPASAPATRTRTRCRPGRSDSRSDRPDSSVPGERGPRVSSFSQIHLPLDKTKTNARRPAALASRGSDSTAGGPALRDAVLCRADKPACPAGRAPSPPSLYREQPGYPRWKTTAQVSTLPRFPHPQTKSPGTWPGLPTRSRLLRDADLLRERLDIHMVIEHLAGSHLDQVHASQLPVPVAVGLTALDLLLPFRCQKMIDLGQQCHVYPCRAHACPQYRIIVGRQDGRKRYIVQDIKNIRRSPISPAPHAHGVSIIPPARP